MKKNELLEYMSEKEACRSAVDWVTESNCQTLAGLWESCEVGEWMLWLAEAAGVDMRRMLNAACDITDLVLCHVPDGEDRPRIANETRRKYANGEATKEEWAAAGYAAWSAAISAARSAAWSAASDAARAAAWSAHADIVRKWINKETIEKAITEEETI